MVIRRKKCVKEGYNKGNTCKGNSNEYNTNSVSGKGNTTNIITTNINTTNINNTNISTNTPFSRSKDILEVLLYDTNHLVRQSACIGTGFLLSQCTEKTTTNYKRIVNRINNLVVERSENYACSIGAVIGRSLLEGGGRNVIYGVKNLFNKVEPTRVGGIVLWMQWWYNYAMFSMVSLCVLPTFYVELDENFNLVGEKDLLGRKDDYEVEIVRMPVERMKRRRKLRRRYRFETFDDKKDDEKKDGENKNDDKRDGENKNDENKNDGNVNIDMDVNIEEERYTVKSGERLTVIEKEKIGLKDYGFIFSKKKE